MKKSGPLPKLARRKRRGFLLMMVVGVLAVLLATVIGFLAYTRGETNAVATIRDKADGADMLASAMDWAIANICNDLMTADTMDEAKLVSCTRNASDPKFDWWYKPLEVGTNSWLGWMGTPTAVTLETKWMYFPDNYFPSKSVRGRFSVQVLDANSALHINDWLEDSNPSQAQVAQMLKDGYGLTEMEKYRYYRDTGVDPLFGGNGNTVKWNKLRYHEAWRMATKTVRSMHWPCWYFYDQIQQEITQTWMTTNTTWQGLYGAEFDCLKTSIQADGIPLYNKRAAQPSMAMYGSQKYAPPTMVEGFTPNSQGTTLTLPGGYSWGNNQSVGLRNFTLPYSLYAYTDPDTGRSPLNVNTAYNSNEMLPTNIFGGIGSYSFEGVFNTDSLRRIIKVGKMYVADLNGTSRQVNAAIVTAPIPAAGIATPAAMVAGTVNNYAPGLAGVKYLRLAAPGTVNLTGLDSTGIANGTMILVGNVGTATINLMSESATSSAANRFGISTYGNYALVPNKYIVLMYDTAGTRWRAFSWIPFYKKEAQVAQKLACRYQEIMVRYFTKTYGYVGTPLYGATGVGPVGTANQAGMSDYSATRFPVSLSQFRTNFRADMATLGTGVFTDGSPDSQATVNFDASDNPLVTAGKIDERTCNAIFDNVVPGKPGANGMPAFPFATGNPDVDDPLTQLYTQRLGRDETTEDAYNPEGFVDDNTGLFDGTANKAGSTNYTAGNGGGLPPASLVGVRLDHTTPSVGAKTLRPKGLDIWQCTDALQPDNCPYRKVAHVPSRTLTFGPDWFSTELTTSSTTYYLVINVQIVKNPTGVGNAPGQSDKPQDIFWSTWMVCVEVAPDVKCETPDGLALSPKNAVTAYDLWDASGLAYYRSGAPFARKTSAYIMDAKPLANTAIPAALATVNQIPYYKYSAFSIKDTLTAPGWGFIRTAVPELLTASARWVDFRGVKPATDADASGYPAALTSDVYYKSARQTKKRVVIRAVWSLNQGMK